MHTETAYYSSEQLAGFFGVSRQAITKKSGLISPFIADTVSRGGRPLRLYGEDAVIALVKSGMVLKTGMPNPLDLKKKRDPRSDSGAPRRTSEELEKKIVSAALNAYLDQPARAAISESVLAAVNTLWAEGELPDIFASVEEATDYFYKRRIMRKDEYFTGYAHRNPSWEDKWVFKWKKSDFALKVVPTMRYSWLDIGRDAGVLQPGQGAATVWWLDDRQADVFVRDDSSGGYPGFQPKGVYLICGWTAMVLDFEPGEPTSYGILRLLLRNIIRFGLPYAIGMENTYAMKSARVDGAIRALYPDALLEKYEKGEVVWLKELFPRANLPFVRNLANIPRHAGKGRMERVCRELKKGDMFFSPRTYRDGNIDPVQLKLGTVPVAPGRLDTIERYWSSMREWLNETYLDRLRPGIFSGISEFCKPNIRSVYRYFSHKKEGTQIPVLAENFVFSLYWLAQAMKIDKTYRDYYKNPSNFDGNTETPPLYVTEVTAKAGSVACRFNGKDYLFVDEKLAFAKGEKIQVLFIPKELSFISDDITTDHQYAALFIFEKWTNKVRFINICRDAFVRRISDIAPARETVQRARAALVNGMRQLTRPTPFSPSKEGKGCALPPDSSPALSEEGRGEVDTPRLDKPRLDNPSLLPAPPSATPPSFEVGQGKSNNRPSSHWDDEFQQLMNL